MCDKYGIYINTYVLVTKFIAKSVFYIYKVYKVLAMCGQPNDGDFMTLWLPAKCYHHEKPFLVALDKICTPKS